MANITLFIDDKTFERACNVAQAMGTSLNQIVCGHIERLSGADQREADHDAYEARARAGKGRLNGWTSDREGASTRG